MPAGHIFAYFCLAAIGFMMFWIGVSRWKQRLSCTEQITGRFLTTEPVRSGKSIKTVGKFEYTYGGQKKTQFAMDDLSGRKKHLFTENETYTLYVNPNNPNEFRCTKKTFSLQDFWLVIMGGFFLFGTLLVVLVEILEMVF